MPLPPSCWSPPRMAESASRKARSAALSRVLSAGAVGHQEVPLGQHGLAARVGVDDAAAGIDEKNRRDDPVDRIGEGRRLDPVQVDHLADQQCTPEMRVEQAYPSDSAGVRQADALVSDDGKGRHRRGVFSSVT